MPKLKKGSLREYNNGFTLIEVAIILVLIGLLIGLGASLIGPLTKRVKVQDTRERIDAAVESVLGYAVATKRLPNGSEFNSTVRNPVDAWGKDLRYVVWGNFTNGTNVICPSDASQHGFKVKIVSATGNRTITNVAFLIMSSGSNFNLQTRFDNGSNTYWEVTDNNTEITIYAPGTINIDDHGADMNRPEEYDDIVKWVTVYELMQRVCYGEERGDEGPLRIITYSLPIGKQNEPYSAEIIAVGGVPFNQTGQKYIWSYNPSPPINGLNFSPPNNNKADFATINGTPSCPGTYNFTATVTDSKGNTASRTFTLSIQPDLITFTPVSGTTWYATNGTSFSTNVFITGGRPNYNTPSNCGSCAGLSCSGNNDTITISGNATNPTTCYFNVTTTDSCNTNASATYAVVIRAPSDGGGSGGGGGGAQIAIVNETGSYVFYQKGTDGTCNQVSNRNCIVVNQGETIRIYRNQGQCQSPNQNPSCSFTYDQLKSFDSNNDGNIRLQPNCIIDDNPTVYCI